MKIAVTYANGEVFQHFGKTEAFKVYDVEDDKVVSSEVIGTDGNGHEALADFLAGKGVRALICGGLGAGAQAALAEAGILVVSGAQGDADAAVEAFLNGELTSAGVNCDHHDHEEEAHHCGGSCGSCGGCHSKPFIVGPNAGKNCKVHYRGTLDDGTVFDSSYDRGEPIEFVCGIGLMIEGFDKAVASLEVGQATDIHLMPEEAYGLSKPEMIFQIPLAQLDGPVELQVGDKVVLYSQEGKPTPVTVLDKDETVVTFDANHELAGKELNFHIELLEAE